MATPAPKPLVCAEKLTLSNAYLEATRELMELHAREMEAVAKNGPLDRYDIAVRRAQANQRSAWKRYIVHAREHGC